MCMTELILVDLDVKFNGQYYRDVLQSQQLLPAIKHVTSAIVCLSFIKTALWHIAPVTSSTAAARTPDFIGPDPLPPNSDCKIWGIIQQRVYEYRSNLALMSWNSASF